MNTDLANGHRFKPMTAFSSQVWVAVTMSAGLIKGAVMAVLIWTREAKLRGDLALTGRAYKHSTAGCASSNRIQRSACRIRPAQKKRCMPAAGMQRFLR